MAMITHLPDDAITIILEKKNINLEDIVNFESTCKRFQQITLSNKFWESKYYQRCPTANKKYNVNKKKKIFDNLDFKEQIKAGIKYMKKLQNYILLMSEDKLWDTNKKELECLLRSIVEDSMLYYFLLDKQKRIIDAGLPWLNDLTYRYNFDLIFNCLKQYRFIYKISKFMNKPRKKRLLEELFTIIAQYFEPRISCSVIKTWLDNIAQEVLYRLKNKYPEHSIFMMSTEQLSFWRDNNIDDHFWDRTEAMQIMNIFNTFLSHDFLFVIVDKLCQLLMTLNVKDKYMNHISEHLKNYLSVTTCHCVTRRLGICSFLVENLYDYIVIALHIPKYDTRDLNTELFQIKNETSYFEDHPYNHIEITIFMIAHFIILRDTGIFYKWNLNILAEILCNYESQSLNNFEHRNIETQYRCITKTIKIAVKQPVKRRNKNNKFPIGMIVKHLSPSYFAPYEENYYHEGVIIGWHSKCDPNFKAKSSMFPYLCHRYKNHRIRMCAPCMGFKSKFVSDDQPHYIILTENDKICYVREDHMERCLPKEINNMEIGRFFSRFHGFYYVPNESLANHYQTVPLHSATYFSLNNSAIFITLNFILSFILSFISILIFFLIR